MRTQRYGLDTSIYSSFRFFVPFVKHIDNPITVPKTPETVGIFGPGHHAVWQDLVTGKSWVFYHRKRGADNGWDRELCVDELSFTEDGGLEIIVT